MIIRSADYENDKDEENFENHGNDEDDEESKNDEGWLEKIKGGLWTLKTLLFLKHFSTKYFEMY